MQNSTKIQLYLTSDNVYERILAKALPEMNAARQGKIDENQLCDLLEVISKKIQKSFWVKTLRLMISKIKLSQVCIMFHRLNTKFGFILKVWITQKQFAMAFVWFSRTTFKKINLRLVALKIPG